MEIGRVQRIPVVAVSSAVSAIPPSRVVRAVKVGETGVSNLAGYQCYGRLPVGVGAYFGAASGKSFCAC